MLVKDLVWATLICALALSLTADKAVAVGSDSALFRPQRLVRLFDFEEKDDLGQKLGQGYELPPNWYAIGRDPLTSEPHFHRQPLHQQLVTRAGFPAYTSVRFDSKYATSGDYSLFLGLQGGSAGAFLEVGTLPAVPNGDYMVTAAVRTDQLQRASAVLVAYFIDAQGQAISASRAYSQPLHSQSEWTTASVKLRGDFPAAAWLGLEVQLLQPAASPDSPLGHQQIVLEDVQGGAWFDDIAVWQLPHVEVMTQSPVNIIQSPQYPQLQLSIRDLTAQQLTADVTIYDQSLAPVDSNRHEVGRGAPSSWTWQPQLPGFGWYLIDMHVTEAEPSTHGSAPIARAMGAFLWMPEQPPLSPEEALRFTLSAEDLPDGLRDLLPQLLTATGLQSVVLSAWTRDTTLENLDEKQGQLEQIIYRLGSAHAVMLSLYPLPVALATQVDSTSALGALMSHRDAWMPFLTPVLRRHGQRIRRWQIGASDQAEAFYYPALTNMVNNIEAQLRTLAPKPQVVLPWRLDQSRRADLPPSVLLNIAVPPAIPAEQLPAYLAEWQTPPADYRLDLKSPPADKVPHPQRAIDLALRMLYAWETQPTGMSLASPWTSAMQRHDALLPDPLLGVFSTVAHHLAGRRVIDRLPIGKGMQCMILDGPSGGLLVAWNLSADPADAVLYTYLGENPVATDIWGNRQTVRYVDGAHRLPLGPSPLFITGIDAELALFRASFRIDPPFIQSAQTIHQRTLTLRNPWPRTINGEFQIVGPSNWTIQPARQMFSLSPGQTLRASVDLWFPIAEIAGPKQLTARFDFTADHHYQVEMSAPMELGLQDVDFDATVGLVPGESPGTTDANVVCVITNTGEELRALYVFANLWGQPRQERIIPRLEPGQSVIRRFRFLDVGNLVNQQNIRTGVRETNGPAILNMMLPLNDLP